MDQDPSDNTGRQSGLTEAEAKLLLAPGGPNVIRTETALENAVSVASVLLLTEATDTEIPETKRERPAEPEMAM